MIIFYFIYFLFGLPLFATMSEFSIASMDLNTPRNVFLSAFYKRSFAFHTIKDRMPVILTQTIDTLVRRKDQIAKDFGKESREELKFVIGELSKLKYEIQTNKPLQHLTTNSSDVRFYNDYITKHTNENGLPTYFGTIWLLAECYMYRKIREAFENTVVLQDFDPFRSQKEESYAVANGPMTELSKYLLPMVDGTKTNFNVQDVFITLIKLNLWGNKCDLSLSNGQIDSHTTLGTIESVRQLEPNILCDNTENIWMAVSDPNAISKTIDVVFDNAGYELFTDLCLSDFIISNKIAEKMRFYVKTIPWFISDVMKFDFYWMLKQLKSSKDTNLKILGERWSNYILNGTWILIENDFWTLPIDYSLMSSANSKLYEQLGEAKLVIFKGDLNYRKLFGEKNWDPVTPVCEALQGFHPTKLCTLRTMKADIVCGLAEGLAEEMEVKDKKWMVSGEYGLIQFCG